MRSFAQIWIILTLICIVCSTVEASHLAPPGDLQFRHDLQLLNDSGVTNIPATAWPIALGDVRAALGETDIHSLNSLTRSAYDRVRERLRFEMDIGSIGVRLGLSGASNPRIIRTVENAPYATIRTC